MIYHFAAIADIGEALSKPTKIFQINAMGTLDVV
jgi:UDP-glucose 4-epimerase